MIGLVPCALPPRDPRFVHGPSEACQLAVPWDGKPLADGAPFAAEHKVDGVRMLYVKGQVLSRELLPLECCEQLLPDLRRLEHRYGRPMMFDAEYQEPDGFIATLAAVSSRKPGKGTATIFDAIPMSAWDAGRDDRPWWQRRELLETAMEGGTLGGLEIADVRRLSADLVEPVAQFVWGIGGEGLMLKDQNAPYVRGRNRHWQKVKQQLRLECTAIEATMGGAALAVDYQGKRLRVTVPMNLRDDIASALGRTVIVEAMEFTERGALRQGRLAHIPQPF